MYAKNFEKLAEKVKKTINFWKIFNLSLPGKIMVVKSLVYPILNYYLSILEPSTEWLKNIELAIESFVLQGMNIGKDKLYLDPDEGGLGLFKPEVFFCALRCSWIKRCTVLTHDNWRRRIINIVDPGPCYVQENDILEFGPIISGILKSLIILRSAFGTVHNNFLMVPVLNNTNFFFRSNGMNNSYYNERFLNDMIPNLSVEQMKTLCWNDFVDTGNFKSINQLQLKYGPNILISPDRYNDALSGFKAAKKKFWKQDKSCMTFHDFIAGKSRGSKPIRKVLENSSSVLRKTKIRDPILNYATIAGIAEIPETAAKALNGMWNKNLFSSDFKVFLFKAHHNILGLNSRVHHFNANRDPACTFCLKEKNLPAERESFAHFFWYCPTTANVIKKFSDTFFSDVAPLGKKMFFTGVVRDGDTYASAAVLTVCKLLQYVLWSFKLRKKLPTWPSFKSEFLYMHNIILLSSPKYRDEVTRCTFFRHFREL
jgi:hypothetical protein